MKLRCLLSRGPSLICTNEILFQDEIRYLSTLFDVCNMNPAGGEVAGRGAGQWIEMERFSFSQKIESTFTQFKQFFHLNLSIFYASDARFFFYGEISFLLDCHTKSRSQISIKKYRLSHTLMAVGEDFCISLTVIIHFWAFISQLFLCFIRRSSSSFEISRQLNINCHATPPLM